MEFLVLVVSASACQVISILDDTYEACHVLGGGSFDVPLIRITRKSSVAKNIFAILLT